MAGVNPISPGTVLVTGAAGSSGSAVIREFARQNLPVRALVRSRPKARALEASPGVEVFEGDMARPDTLVAALRGVERILMISSADPQMVETQCTFIDAARNAGAPQFPLHGWGRSSGAGSPTGSARAPFVLIGGVLLGLGTMLTSRASAFGPSYFRRGRRLRGGLYAR